MHNIRGVAYECIHADAVFPFSQRNQKELSLPSQCLKHTN